jgi:hypothetical protein
MSALPYISRIVIPAAFLLLEEIARDLKHRAAGKLAVPYAKPALLAIGLQESRFEHRKQIRGPALSFWQAESGGGFRGILFHTATKDVARDLLQKMAYGEPDDSDFQAIEHNDILACCGARLLLWTHPDKLPGIGEPERAWQMYLDTWRPGKPHESTWAECWRQAWAEMQRV